MAITTIGEEDLNILAREILSRIPAIDLLKTFTLVCKQWRRLISSPEFIQIHLEKSKERNSDGTQFLVRQPNSAAIYPGGKRIPYPPPLGFSNTGAKFLGSCDGLICLYDEGNRRFAVYNPSTNKYDLRLADKFRSLFLVSYTSWFGRNPSTGEYVLVVGSHVPQSHFDIRVYTLRTHVSRSSIHQKKHGRHYRFFGAIGDLLHGALHWAACTEQQRPNEHVIVAYDFRKNEILEIPPPCDSRFTLGVMGECLCVIFRNADRVFELWTMREYGVKESWTKYANILGFSIVDNYLVPLGFCSDGDYIIVDADREVAKYGFRDKRRTVLKKHSHLDFKAFSYVDSLVNPEIIYE
ncbi:hypothetical protein ACP275_14G038300 [Erythranthe tilingii]